MLSAILFADIAGYTGLMQENEKEAVRSIGRFKSIIEKNAETFEGRIIQYYGDGCLLSFSSATQATECAIGMQQAFMNDPKIPVRIGIHLGEVLYRNENAFGNGVNVASRIESMGLPGSVLVSKTIRDLLINKEGFELKSLGEFLFKHVKEPIEVFAIEKENFVTPSRDEMLSRMKAGKRTRSFPRWVLPVAVFVLLLTVTALLLKGGNKKEKFLPDDKKEKPLTVVSFENLTKDKKLDVLGLMIKDWVSNSLLEVGRNVIVSKKGEYDDLSTEKGKAASIPAGVEVIVKGRYYIPAEGQVAAVAEILDAGTEKVLVSTKPVISSKDSLDLLLADIEQQITAQWEGEDYKNKRQPPDFESFRIYIKGLGLENSDPPAAANYYLQAYRLDTNFRSPLFALTETGIKRSQKIFVDSLLSELGKREDEFSDYEKTIWEDLKIKAEAKADQ